jgi:tRNA (adenine57-N1/adenine58-N1)-methyltransferase
MSYRTSTNVTQEGDYVQLVGPRNKLFFITLQSGAKLHTNYGVLEHNEMINAVWGAEVCSHSGNRFLVLQPRLGELLLKIRRSSQIMYPKDIGFLIVHLGIGPGDRVIEAGTGSGALTTALSYFVGPEGRVYSYDSREDMQELARENLEKLNLLDPVTFWRADVRDGFHEREVDAIILDLPKPDDHLVAARQALKAGGSLGAILPTTNQVSDLVSRLETSSYGPIEIFEILLRAYKPVPHRLRPKDRMVGHTGFLVFARKLTSGPSSA